MTRTGVHFTALAASIAGVVCGGSPALAADDEWQFAIVPYIWLPSVETAFQSSDLPVEVETDTSASDIFDQLDFALLVSGEARKGRFGLLYDVQYLELSDDGTTGGPVPREFDADVTFAEATLALEYRLVESPRFSLDAFAGARVLYADVGAELAPGPLLPAFGGGDSETWVDPIVGVKTTIPLGEKWALFGYADIGGFSVSSDLTYRLLGTVSYRLNGSFAIHAGYSLFAVDFERDEFEFDATMHGPVIGFGFSF